MTQRGQCAFPIQFGGNPCCVAVMARGLGSGVGQGQSRATVFNARNLCPKTPRFLPWFPDEQPLTLFAKLKPAYLQQCA